MKKNRAKKDIQKNVKKTVTFEVIALGKATELTRSTTYGRDCEGKKKQKRKYHD